MAKTYHHGDLKLAAVEKAAEIIQKKGDVDFTLREIAASLKVSHTAVYRHFASKQDLISHVAEQGFMALGEAFAQSLEKTRSPRQALRATGRTYIEFAIENPGYYRGMFHRELRCEVAQRPELDKVQAAAFQSLMGLIEEGIKTKDFQKVPPLVAARTIWSGVHGFSMLILDGQFQSVQTAEDQDLAISKHLDLLMRALL